MEPFSNPERLRHAIHAQRPLAFIGAGLSVRAGYPTWNALLEGMSAQLKQQQASIRDDALWRAEEIRAAFQEDERYFAALEAILQPPQRELDPTITNVVQLPFRHMLTTNYDDVLERAHERVFGKWPESVEWRETPKVREFITRISEPVEPEHRKYFHVHGRLGDRQSIVLSERDYTERYLASDVAYRKLFAIFATQPVVFLGFSLEDAAFVELLRIVRHSLGGGEPRHFAVLADKDDGDEQRKARIRWMRAKFEIDPVFYRVAEGDTAHVNFATLIDELWSGERREAFSAKSEDDPNRYAFGGSAEARGRRLSADVSRVNRIWFNITVTVSSIDPARPLQGIVTLHLHPTFDPQTIDVRVIDGVATYSFMAWGSFVVGAVADGGATRLELDLAMANGADDDFALR